MNESKESLVFEYSFNPIDMNSVIRDELKDRMIKGISEQISTKISQEFKDLSVGKLLQLRVKTCVTLLDQGEE